MKMNQAFWQCPWRKELQALLGTVPVSRRPTLRRSLLPDWLYASDLPRCAEEDCCRAFAARVEALHWEVRVQEDWMQLRKTGLRFTPEWFPERAGPEAGCLRELLLRHPGSADPALESIALIKAREEGPDAFELACRALHRELARRLRAGEPFPEIDLSFTEG